MSDIALPLAGAGILFILAGLLPKKNREKLANFFQFNLGENKDVNTQSFEQDDSSEFIFGGSGDDILKGTGGDLLYGFIPRIQAPTAPQINTAQIEQEAFNRAKSLLIAREGRRNVVYRDSRGFPTVGIGHLVLERDNLKLGDRISDARIEAFFKADIDKAFQAALRQAREINQSRNPDMIATLTSVNFQLGTGWTSDFKNTWSKLKNGDWRGAIRNIQVSRWDSQTPTRTNDFINAIERAYA